VTGGTRLLVDASILSDGTYRKEDSGKGLKFEELLDMLVVKVWMIPVHHRLEKSIVINSRYLEDPAVKDASTELQNATISRKVTT
jgi:hypothetical protein